MKTIDAHMHFSRIAAFEACAKAQSFVDYSLAGYLRERRAAGIAASIVMGLEERAACGFPDRAARTPMTADLLNAGDAWPEGLFLCPGVNPHDLGPEALQGLGEALRREETVGIKIYAGYYHVPIADAVYEPVYRMAMECDVPVVFHSGDTYSSRGLLKLSHPLCVDEVAVMHPEMRIVICHMGEPWMIDACEVAMKNPNVFIDLSGMIIGDEAAILRFARQPPQRSRFLEAVGFLGELRKLLFGTDWPLAEMRGYIDFIQEIIPREAWADVFYANALRVYTRMRGRIPEAGEDGACR